MQNLSIFCKHIHVKEDGYPSYSRGSESSCTEAISQGRRLVFRRKRSIFAAASPKVRQRNTGHRLQRRQLQSGDRRLLLRHRGIRIQQGKDHSSGQRDADNRKHHRPLEQSDRCRRRLPPERKMADRNPRIRERFVLCIVIK